MEILGVDFEREKSYRIFRNDDDGFSFGANLAFHFLVLFKVP